MNKFYVIICGGREFSDYTLLKTKCDTYLSKKMMDPDTEIIVCSGCATGADELGEKYANERGFSILKYPADWEKYGKSAGYRRNSKMAEIANACIAFYSSYGKNKGTKMMVDIARKKNLLVREVQEEN